MKMDDLDETSSIASTDSDRTVLSPLVPMSVFDKFLCLTNNLSALVSCIIAEAGKNIGASE